MIRVLPGYILNYAVILGRILFNFFGSIPERQPGQGRLEFNQIPPPPLMDDESRHHRDLGFSNQQGQAFIGTSPFIEKGDK